MSVPFAVWFLLKRSNSQGLKWPAFLVIFLYSANFGNVFGISVVHSMEVPRYSTVQFIGALFAQLWAIRWLIEIALMRLDNIKVATSWSFNPKPTRATGLKRLIVELGDVFQRSSPCAYFQAPCVVIFRKLTSSRTEHSGVRKVILCNSAGEKQRLFKRRGPNCLDSFCRSYSSHCNRG